MKRSRVSMVIVIGVLCTAVAIGYTVRAKRLRDSTALRDTGVKMDTAALGAVLERPHVLFRTTRIGAEYGRVVAVPNDRPAGTRLGTTLACDRVAASPRGGVCLTADRGVNTKYWAVVFDKDFQPVHRVPLGGIPSRVRLSPDGRLAGITVFVSGHAYSDGSFSTITTLLDTSSGQVIGDLERFTVSRDGRPFKNANFNFWGVTFARDSQTFFATLGSGTDLYLIRGDSKSASATVIAEGIECPSLSPDNQRIAFKKRTKVGNQLIWRLAVLDLASGSQRVIDGETRNIDDQVEWLDDTRILYAVADESSGAGGTSIWTVGVDGGPASLWTDGAYSPSVVVASNR